MGVLTREGSLGYVWNLKLKLILKLREHRAFSIRFSMDMALIFYKYTVKFKIDLQ